MMVAACTGAFLGGRRSSGPCVTIDVVSGVDGPDVGG